MLAFLTRRFEIAAHTFLRLRTIPLLLLLIALCGCGAAGDREGAGENDSTISSPALTAVYSDLWGQAGELWTPQSRLPDFSFAGYRMGTSAIPTPAVVANVKNFGAVGDGIADDSQAFLNAIAAANNGAISIPAGRYKITKVLKITKSNVVLRGAGVGSTTLFFPNSLTDLMGTAPAWAGNSGAWSWAGGFLWWEGKDNGVKLANVTGTALRGGKSITVDSTAGISVGTTIRLLEFNNDGTLGTYLHDGLSAAGTAAPSKLVDFAVKVTAVSGNTITLERPLRADVRAVWTPQIYSFAPSVQETGVEDLTMEFPNTAYAGHLVEKGYNAIYLDGVANCWIKNVTILDADSGITTSPSAWPDLLTLNRFCTIDNVRLANQWRPSSGLTGHHGIALESPQDMLITNFTIAKQFVHDVTVDSASCGNVFSHGSGVNMNFDHHRGVPYENLFTDIDVGPGDTLFIGSRTSDSGNADGGPPSGVRETLWDIRASNAQNPPPNWPLLNIVGMTRYATQKTGNLWIEQIDPAALVPVNLYAAELARRQGGTPPPVLTTVTVSPSTATVSPSATQQFSASGLDQFGNPMSPQPTFSWSVSGGGTINGSGLFTAGATTGGPFVVTASSGGKSGTASVTVASSSNVTLTTTADAFVRDGGSATTNFGSATALEVKLSDAGWIRNTYVKFDLSSVSGTFSSVKLRLFGSLGGTDSVNVSAYGVSNTTWTEGGLTWNTAPAPGATALSTLAVAGTTASWREWDVTSYVQAEKSAGRNIVALALKSSTFSASVASFNSKEAGSNAPQLVVSVGGGGPPNQAPTVSTPAAASPSTVTGNSTNLSVAGNDDGGEPNLKYTWATTGSPPAPVTFSAGNGTNAGKNSTATFTRAGSYSFQVTIADVPGLTATSSTSVTVTQTLTSIAVSPSSTTVSPSTTKQFSATASDQFGVALSTQPAFTWTVSGGGTISSSGLFTAGSVAGGPFTVTAASGGKSGTASVTISGSSSSVTLGTIADAFVRDGAYAANNYGSATDLQVKTHTTDWSRNSFLKFDLSSVSGSITNAKLRLFGNISAADTLNLQAFGVSNTSFSESTLTWSNQPAAGASALASLLLSSTVAQWCEWDITSYVQSEKSAGHSLIALLLKSATFSATFADFASREAASNQPQLVISVN